MAGREIEMSGIPKPVDGTQHLLKHCPLCGSTAHIWRTPGDWGYDNDKSNIRCDNDNCGLSLPSRDTEKWEQGVGTFSIQEQVEAKLIARWNTRAATEKEQIQ